MEWVSRRAWIALVALLAVAAVFLLHETRGTTLWFDEWTWALTRRGSDLDTFLKPHGGHLSLVGIALYKLLFATAGIDDYTPYRALVIAAHLVCVALVFVYASRRVGGLLALLVAALILFLGPGWPDVLWPFQVSWLISLGAGVGALLMLDRADRNGDVGACALLLLSLASSSLGVAIALGAAVELAWGRRTWRALWIVALPVALYGLWWLIYHETSAISRHNIAVTPPFVADGIAASIAALAGLADQPTLDARGTLLDWGRPLAVVAIALLAWRLTRLRPVGPRVLALLTIALSFWTLTALNRANISPPYSNRYLYVGALFVVLIAVELARGVRVPPATGAVLTVVAVAVVVSNIGAFRDGGRYLRETAQVTKADLGAVEVGRQLARPDFAARALPGFPLLVLTAGPYFATERDVGTPAASPDEIAASSEGARRAADTELIALHRVALMRSPAGLPHGAPPRVDLATGGTVTTDGACMKFVPARIVAPGAVSEVQVTVPAAGVALSAEGARVAVGVRRFADGYQPVGTLAASSSATLRIGSDAAPQPWHVRLTAAGPVAVCGLG